MARIHPSAVVDPAAELADDVDIGPFCVVGPQVRIGAGTRVLSHVALTGRTSLGRDNRVHPFCALGGEPQDKKFAGEDTALEIGDGNTIREHCTFSLGTAQGGAITRVGNDNWIMANVHVAHDCVVGHHTILANNVTLAGHVTLGDWVILGGLAAVHQFVRVGAHAMAAGGSIVLRDVPPFVMCSGNPAEPHGINTEGLRRRGFDGEVITGLRRVYKTIYREGLTVAEAVAALQAAAALDAALAPHAQALALFLQDSARGIIR